MRKTFMLVVLMALGVSSASAARLGLGAYGGMNIPIVQEDQSSGTTFGLKAKLGLLPGIALEPNINFAKFGDATFEFGTRTGSKVNSYGVDACLGSGLGTIGFKMYGLLGFGYYTVTRDYDEDIKKIGWTTGLGFEIGFTESFGVEIRGKLNVIDSGGGGSKKAAAVTGGLNYYLGY
ncbi:exported hypothetical protein [Candidatus Zixiibacteriota bacterium]|nr:exported hypothetical protein [candidate division Zixibacteria bacterium]